ncbi:spore gernimation protein [Sporolactobacillus sp. THM7-4]|nr:spore gernimation protein [Sporolactobacillus sp. THM7-4]
MYRQPRIFLVLTAALLSLFLLLAGCGAQDREPTGVKYVGSKSELNKTVKKTETVKRELYLENEYGRLAPQMVALPVSDAPAKQVLEYLVKEGPVTDLLPNGFQAVLPPDTMVRSAVLDRRGNMTADFSKDFLDAPANEQDQIVQSIVWTLTQFDSVKKVTISVDGRNLNEWPNTKRPISQGLSRSDGINTTFSGVADISGSEPLTVYYLSSNKGHTYYVPVTVRVAKTSKETDRLASLVNAMIHEPEGSEFISIFNPGTALVEKPVVENGVVHLHFNNDLFTNSDSKTVSDAALRCLILTLTGEDGIQKVSIKVGDSSKVMLESGKKLSGPVSRNMVVRSGL